MNEIFRVGDINYPDKGMGKPIHYTADFLKQIASSTGEITLSQEHGEEIGKIKNFIFKDDVLYGDIPKGLDVQGLGFSPTFDTDLVEHDNYYIPTNGELVEVALTTKPRSNLIYNSQGDGDMDNTDYIEKLASAKSENADLLKQINELKEQNMKLNTSKAEAEKLSETIEANKKELKKLQEEAEANKDFAKKYSEIEKTKREELIKAMAGDDEEAKNKLANLPIETLEFFKDKKLVNTKPNGIGENNATGLNTDGVNQHNHDKKETNEEKLKRYEDWKKQNSIFL